MKLLERQEQLHKEATQLLEEVLYPLLKQFGTVSVGGSYAYKLLNHSDIDLDVTTPNLTREQYIDLCTKLISLKEVSSFRTADRVNFPHTHDIMKPTGYWMSPKIHFGENIWNLDIWLQLPEWNTGNTNGYEEKLSNLSEEQKISILTLKEELLNAGIYGVGKEFISVDVYDAVLSNKVTNIEELRNYKVSTKGDPS